MKFPHKDSKRIQITDHIQLDEYCSSNLNLPIDGAYATINGSLGPKINKTFSELFFVISGTLMIEQEGEVHELGAKDMFIVKPNIKHKIIGTACEVFISCAPQFSMDEVEFVDE